MSRVTSANVCRQESQVIVVATGKTVTGECARAQGHPGDHVVKVKVPKR